MRAVLVLLLVVGCGGGDDTYIVVTVERRPAVHDVVRLEVTLSNGGSMRTDSLEIPTTQQFPLTFSISAPGRNGDLGIAIDGLDTDGVLQGRGVSTAKLDADAATVVLDSADFVVNALYVNNQFLSNDFEAVGLQLAPISNGTWTAAFREDCMPCNVLGRRFDMQGLPVRTELAAGTTQFNLTTTLTTSGAIPAVAASGMRTMVVWDFFDTVGTGQGVACRTFDQNGAALPGQATLATDAADVVTVAPLSNSNFVVTWQSFIMSAQVIRAVVALPDCTVLGGGAPRTISTTSGTFGARRSHAAANGASVLYAWIVDGDVHMRYAGNDGVPVGTESTAIPKTAALEVDHVRVTPWGTGFAAVVRWAGANSMGPGKIEVFRIPATGASPVTMGGPILATDKSGSDFASDKAFGVAQRGDGALMVVWHACASGPGSCETYARILRPTGVPVGEEFVVATSTTGDQVNPSVAALDDPSLTSERDPFVAAWNDSSGAEPDSNGTAVRARILYPVYDDARGVIGATCGASAPGGPPCGDGLACGMGSDMIQRCYTVCTPPSCPSGGSCSPADGGQYACLF